MNGQAIKKTCAEAAKAGLSFFIVGIVLAAAATIFGGGLAPLIGATAADAAAKTPILWTGIFFAGFGALAAGITPCVNYVFSGKSSQPSPHAASEREGKLSLDLLKYLPTTDASNIVNLPDVNEANAETRYRKIIEEARAQDQGPSI